MPALCMKPSIQHGRYRRGRKPFSQVLGLPRSTAYWRFQQDFTAQKSGCDTLAWGCDVWLVPTAKRTCSHYLLSSHSKRLK